MGLFVQRDEKRSELQERVAASLNEKAARKAREIERKEHDDVEDSAYMKDYKHTTSLAWVWLIVAILAIAVIIYFIVRL